MTGRVVELNVNQGSGALRGEDGRTYSFRRKDLRDCWYHDLTIGVSVTFELHSERRPLDAINVRLARDHT